MTTRYNVHLSDTYSHEVEIGEDGALRLDGIEIDLDAVRTGHNTWHILRHNKSYNIRLISFDKEHKRLALSVNDEEFELHVTTQLDRLLSSMGMDAETASRMVDVRAPMPGLVLRVLTEPGLEVSEGDPLIILEAMKMENVIKATGKGVVAKILVSNQDTVDKNQVLMEME